MTIKEVGEKYNLSNDTLRYYEKVGLIGPIKKNKSGIRDYNDADLKRIEFVKYMRSAELPINALVEYINLFDSKKDTIKERKELLEHQRDLLKEKIDEMLKAYELLNYKRDLYNKNLLDEKLN